MSAFSFVDGVTEVVKGQRISAFFTLTGREEFLKNHFEKFPVMPGVLLLESLKQAASRLLTDSSSPNDTFYRLVSAEDVKFGQFVKPGSRLEISAKIQGRHGLSTQVEGRIDLVEEGRRRRALSASIRLAPFAA